MIILLRPYLKPQAWRLKPPLSTLTLARRFASITRRSSVNAVDTANIEKGDTMAKQQTKKDKVVDLLNEARSRELTAILQYMSQHYELEDQDFGKLALPLKMIAIEEMRHAEMLAERILFLGGTPTSAPAGKVKKGEEIAGMLATNVGLEEEAIEMYNDHAQQCTQLGDHVSKELFETLLVQEEGHFDQFGNIQGHIKKLGAAYLVTLAGGQSEPGAAEPAP